MSNFEDVIEFLSTHPSAQFSIVRDPESIDSDEKYTISFSTNHNDSDLPKTSISGVTRCNVPLAIEALLSSIDIIFE